MHCSSCAYQSPVLLEFLHVLESGRELLLIDATQRRHVLLAASVAVGTTRWGGGRGEERGEEWRGEEWGGRGGGGRSGGEGREGCSPRILRDNIIILNRTQHLNSQHCQFQQDRKASKIYIQISTQWLHMHVHVQEM